MQEQYFLTVTVLSNVLRVLFVLATSADCIGENPHRVPEQHKLDSRCRCGSCFVRWPSDPSQAVLWRLGDY